MPSKYILKTNRKFRSTPDILERAAKEVAEEGLSYRVAGDKYGVDKMTLMRYIKKKKNNASCVVGYTALSINKQILSPEMEKDLSAHIVHMADMYFGLSPDKCKELAFEYAVKNNIQTPQSWQKNRKAGKQWWIGFKQRHKLSIRLPEATSIGRATAFNRHTVSEYFTNLGDALDKHKFTADRIFNIDETGVTTVQNPKKVVTTTGIKNVGSVTSAERGDLVTLVYAICAVGHALPPMFIFPRKYYKEHFIRGAPAGSIGKGTKSGWINEELFIDFLNHISDLTGCSPDRKILVIMDNHSSHVSIAAIDKARDRGVVLLTIPPKTSHKLQPLDKSVFGPFKNSYNKATDNWMRSNPGKTLTIYDIPSLVNEAQMTAIVPRNILSGFSSTGNWPFNPDVFTESDFAPAIVTDRELVQDVGNTDESQIFVSESISNEEASATFPARTNLDEDLPNVSSVSTSYVSPRDILPIPKAPPRKRSNRRRGKTRIYTDTPVRNEVEEQSKKKKLKEVKKNSKKARRSLFSKKIKISTQPVMNSSSSEEEEVPVDNDSDANFSDDVVEPNVGDYVVVLVSGRSRSLKYIARVDDYNAEDDEYEGVFLRKVNTKIYPESRREDPIFIVNEHDDASFTAKDMVLKLPAPVAVGGSARRCNQLRFEFDFSRIDIG